MSDGEVEALREEVATLSRVVADLKDMVIGLSEDIVRYVVRDAPSSVRSWLATDDPEMARLMLADLEDWLRRVWVLYPGPRLAECWAYHPAVVEELWTVMNLHRSCFRKGGTHQALADWHARYRPGAAERIEKETGTCALSEHAPGAEQDPTLRPELKPIDLVEVADCWAEYRRAPYPTV